MAEERQRTKYVPSFVHTCDDFEIIGEDGTVYYPHAGEWVRFRSDLPWRLARLDSGMPNLEYAEMVVDLLRRQVLDWNWTGDDGQPLPKPDDDPRGFTSALWDLGEEERIYLRRFYWGRTSLGEAKSSPS
jgi:hypothetical protein